MIKTRIKLSMTCILGFLASWGEGLNLAQNINLSKAYPIIGGVLLVFSVITSKGKIRIFSKKYVTFIIMVAGHTLIAYSIIALFISNHHIDSVNIAIIRFFLFFLISYALIEVFTINELYINYFSFFLGTGLLVSLIVDGYQGVVGANVFRVSGGYADPNAFGFVGVLCLFLSFHNYFTLKSNKFIKAFSLVMATTSIFVILISGSRGAYLGMAIGGLYIFNKSELSNKIKILLMLSSVSLVAISLLPEESINALVQRISLANAIEDRGAKRLDIWITYLSQWKDYWLFGVGMRRSSSVLIDTDIYWSSVTTHNTYLEVLVEYGALIFIVYLGFLKEMFYNLRVKYKKTKAIGNKIITGLLISFLVQSFFMNTFGQRVTWIIFALCISQIVLSNRKVLGGGK